MNHLLPNSASYSHSRAITPPLWINTAPLLEELLVQLSTQPVVAVDTESDSLYRYFEKICLIQFSIPGTDYLVDPFAVDPTVLAPVFANPAIQKVFHAAEYDVLCLKRDFGFSFANFFDTMVAARILGWPHYGLSALLEQYFTVKLDKSFQRYNWRQRPLDADAIHYARLDTRYLLPLREIQLEQLQQIGRLQEALEAFARETHFEPTPKLFNPEGFWRIKGAKELDPQQQAVLRQLFITRDNIARQLDHPPFRVIGNSTLLRLAKQQPKRLTQLQHIKEFSHRSLQESLPEILNAIIVGQAAPPPQPHSDRARPDPQVTLRYEALRHWRNTAAAARGVEPDVIMSNHTLMDIARHNPKTLATLAHMELLGEWQYETYGKTLLKVLKNAH
jgi:ribonuclease D